VADEDEGVLTTSRQLALSDVEAHLSDFGIRQEFASNTSISRLSEGLKAQVMLAAVMWLTPHILILDEPGDYFDSEAMDALLIAIKSYKGGVLIFSRNENNEQFARITDERWTMPGGRLHVEGGTADAEELIGRASDKRDGMNVSNLRAKVTQETIQALGRRLKDGVENKSLSEAEMQAMFSQFQKLKKQLARA